MAAEPKLTRGRIKAAIIREGSVRAAAIKLGVSRAQLRGMVKRWPALLEAATEAEERALDAAEANLLEALRSDNKVTRLQAASHIVRRSGRLRSD